MNNSIPERPSTSEIVDDLLKSVSSDQTDYGMFKKRVFKNVPEPESDPREARSQSMENYAKEYVDQKFETERVRTDSRFIEVLSEIKLLREDTKNLRDSSLTKTQLWNAVGTGAAAVLTLGLAALAFGGDRFDAGVNLSSELGEIRNEQSQRDAAQDARLDQILTAIESLRADQP